MGEQSLVLNGHELGHTDNMFRRNEWEIKPLLNSAGENVLTITFASPVKFIAEKNAIREMPGPYHSMGGGPYIRKAPYQFGWDWGPQLPPIGIWKDITKQVKLEKVKDEFISAASHELKTPLK